MILALKRQKTGCGQTKVADFHLVSRVQEYVDGLQIPMDNALLMNVRQTLGNLTEQTPQAVLVGVQSVIDCGSNIEKVYRNSLTFMLNQFEIKPFSNLNVLFSQNSI